MRWTLASAFFQLLLNLVLICFGLALLFAARYQFVFEGLEALHADSI